MKRIQEKVKDIVDARPYKSLRDFASDPMQTVSIYHFTDFTSDLMTKWLDKVALVQPRSGAAYALAGYRGVGKSHFLAALGAIVSHPELRSKITDQRVAASAQTLRRTRYPVAYVRRGTNETLIGELKEAIAQTFEINAASLSDSVSDLLKSAAEKAGELPFVLFIDCLFLLFVFLIFFILFLLSVCLRRNTYGIKRNRAKPKTHYQKTCAEFTK
jgi:hypothetical protein